MRRQMILAVAALNCIAAHAKTLDVKSTEGFAKLALSRGIASIRTRLRTCWARCRRHAPRQLTPPSSAATTGTPRCTATGCWPRAARLSRNGPLPRRRRGRAGHQPDTAEHRRRGRVPARAGRVPSSGPMDSRGCCSSRPSCASWDDPQAREWSATLAPLEQAAAARSRAWLPKLRTDPRGRARSDGVCVRPDLGLGRGRATMRAMQQLLRMKADEFYRRDRACPLSTNRLDRTSCRRVSPRRTSCGACSTEGIRHVAAAFLPEITARRVDCVAASGRGDGSQRIRSWRTSMDSISAGRGCSKGIAPRTAAGDVAAPFIAHHRRTAS